MRRVACFLFVFGLLASCSVFDAAMRSDANDAGASSSGLPGRDASDDRSIAQPGVEDAGDAEAGDDISDEPIHGSNCGWIMRDGVGASGCSDPGEVGALAGDHEVERNDTVEKATPMTRNVPMCGIVKAGRVDIFAFDVPAGGCFHIDVDSDGDLELDIKVEGPGVGLMVIPNNKRLELPGKATSAGRVFVTLSTPLSQGNIDVSYKLAVR